MCSEERDTVVEQLMELQALAIAMEEAARTIRKVSYQQCKRLELESARPAVVGSGPRQVG